MRERIGLSAAGPAPVGFAPRQYVDMKIGRYWDLNIPAQEGATASGFYVATDPVISRAFGGTGNVWSMIEVVLGKGFRFVDVRRWPDKRAESQKFPPELQAVLRQAGCGVRFPVTLLITLESQSCRQIAVRVANILHADGILQDFPAKSMEPCPDRVQGGLRIVLQFPKCAARQCPATSIRCGIRFFRSAADRGHVPARTPTGIALAPSPGTICRPSEPAPGRTHGCMSTSSDAAPTRRIALPMAYPRRRRHRSTAKRRTWPVRACPEKAIVAYKAALEADGDFIPALDELAWILATSPDPAYRDPAEAERLAGHLVELTHYKFRNTTWGMMAKAYKVPRLAHAGRRVRRERAGDFQRAAEYATQSLETARRLAEVAPSPTIDRLVADGREYLKLYQSGRPFVAQPGFQRTPVAMH